MKKISFLVFLVLLAGGILSACGGSSDPEKSSAPDPHAVESSAEKMETGKQETIETATTVPPTTAPPTTASPATKSSAELEAEIDAKLQGKWYLNGNNAFEYDKGILRVSTDGNVRLQGLYTIDIKNSVINADFKTSDGAVVTITLDYTYSNGLLRIFNNEHEEFIKQ